jgi:hypothetical protein
MINRFSIISDGIFAIGTLDLPIKHILCLVTARHENRNFLGVWQPFWGEKS